MAGSGGRWQARSSAHLIVSVHALAKLVHKQSQRSAAVEFVTRHGGVAEIPHAHPGQPRARRGKRQASGSLISADPRQASGSLISADPRQASGSLIPADPRQASGSLIPADGPASESTVTGWQASVTGWQASVTGWQATVTGWQATVTGWQATVTE